MAELLTVATQSVWHLFATFLLILVTGFSVGMAGHMTMQDNRNSKQTHSPKDKQGMQA